MLQKNPHLSIVIPTYNRAPFLAQCLKFLIPAAKSHNIGIYVSDNNSEDNTKEIVDKIINDYSFIEYHCNEENLGPDKNFEIALKIPQTNYIWLLGDTYQIKFDSLDFILKNILNKQSEIDAIVINVNHRVKDVKSRDYTEKNGLLGDLGWHMTCLSSLIYSKHLIDGANFKRYRETYFIQTGIIFEYIEDKEFLIEWVNEQSVDPIILDKIRKVSWREKTFEIWVERWSNFVFSLPPSYEIKTKLYSIKNHGSKSELFSARNLLSLRASGILDIATFRKFTYLFPWVVSSVFVVFIISLLPKNFLKIMKSTFGGRIS